MSGELYLVVLLTILIIAAVLIFTLIVLLRNRRIMRKAEHAAKVLLRGKVLESVIKGDSETYCGLEVKPMLMVRMFHPTKRYVFDLTRCIYIGRNTNHNHIAIQNELVSDLHCRIYLRRGKVMLEDLNSTNGTFVRHRLKKNRVTEKMELLKADKIYIGTIVLQVYPFYIDTTLV